MNIVIGGGIAGLLVAYYRNAVVLSSNIGGQFTNGIQMGPRFIHYSDKVVDLLQELNIKFTMKKCRVGYFRGTEEVEFSDTFKEDYAKCSRNSEFKGKSILNSSKSSFMYLDFDMKEFISKISLKLTIINKDVMNIDIMRKVVILEDMSEMPYDTLYSTVHANTLMKLLAKDKVFKCYDKLFAKIKSDSVKLCMNNVYNLDKYDYVYVTNNIFSRIFKVDNDIVVEFNVFDASHIENLCLLFSSLAGECEYSVAKDIQVVENANLKELDGIKLYGRFARLNHSIKFTEIVEELVNERIEELVEAAKQI